MTTERKLRWVLEMKDLSELQPQRLESSGLDIRRARIPFPALNRFLHREVGTPFRWGGREDWGDEEWAMLANDPTVQTWVAYLDGTIAGYYEIQKEPEGSVRILNFGLRLPFIGKGHGRYMLTHAVRSAFALNPTRVWLRTCNFDHPHALKNYKARGFRLIDEIWQDEV